MPEIRRIDELDERSDQVREVMGKAPGWTIAWGTTVIFICFALLLLLLYIVKYPDLVQARIVITTPLPPTGIVAQADGKLNPILVQDKQSVESGTLLAIIENPARTKEVLELKNQLLALNIDRLNGDSLQQYTPFAERPELGEIQKDYSLFLKDYNALRSYFELDPLNKEIHAVRKQEEAYQLLVSEQKKQNEMFKQELSFGEIEYDRNKKLHQANVISDKDMEDKEMELIRVRRGYKTFQLEMANTGIQFAELDKNLTQLHVQNSELSTQLFLALKESYKNMLSAIALWEQKYLLKAPISGKVTFFKYWSPNQFVKTGEEVLIVVPKESSEVIGRVTMPVMNSGKVKSGQRVNVRLDSYPAAEFGSLTGQVESISLVPRNNMYAISVRFPTGLQTTYRKKLQMMQEMEGSAEIVTEDLCLLERIFYQFRSIFKARH